MKKASAGTYIYIAYDDSPQRLPWLTASTPWELAEKVGVSLGCIQNIISRWENGKVKNPKYARILVEQEEL